jgi:hypothetical protein
MGGLRPSSWLRRASRGLLIGAICGAALVVATPAISSSAPADIQLTPTSGPAGTKIGVQVHFPEQCEDVGVNLTDPTAGTNQFIVLEFSKPNANGSANAHILVPADTPPGEYSVSGACIGTVPQSSDLHVVTATFTVTGPAVPEAAVQISPTEGPPGTAIDATLAVSPPGYCGADFGVELRTAQPFDGTILDFVHTQTQPATTGPFHLTLTVPADAVVGTTLYVDGGCGNAYPVSPGVPFLVTGPTQTPAPWWKLSQYHLDNGIANIELLLSTGAFPFDAVVPTTTTTTRPRTRTTVPTLPPPPPPAPTTSTTEYCAPPGCKP